MKKAEFQKLLRLAALSAGSAPDHGQGWFDLPSILTLAGELPEGEFPVETSTEDPGAGIPRTRGGSAPGLAFDQGVCRSNAPSLVAGFFQVPPPGTAADGDDS